MHARIVHATCFSGCALLPSLRLLDMSEAQKVRGSEGQLVVLNSSCGHPVLACPAEDAGDVLTALRMRRRRMCVSRVACLLVAL